MKSSVIPDQSATYPRLAIHNTNQCIAIQQVNGHMIVVASGHTQYSVGQRINLINGGDWSHYRGKVILEND